VRVDFFWWVAANLGQARPGFGELSIRLAFNSEVHDTIGRGIDGETIKALVLDLVLEHEGA
jgi:hypothetical protein